MWSGPRNISTALMRSWEARGDTAVWDEPLYAHYLAVTGRPHPGADEVMAAHESDWRTVVRALTGPVPGGSSIFYQKHMAHHLVGAIESDWVGSLENCFLVRSPAEMIASLAKVVPDPGVEETGLPQQVHLFETLRAQTGSVPPVIDARDVLQDPAGLLSRLCARLGLPYTERMLCWAPGRRSSDGVWARHWYAAVEASTGFEPWRPRNDPVPAHLQGLLAECEELYGALWRHRIT